MKIMLGLYKFSLQATVDHRGNYLDCGQCGISVNYFEKKCNDNRITECDIGNTHNSTDNTL